MVWRTNKHCTKRSPEQRRTWQLDSTRVPHASACFIQDIRGIAPEAIVAIGIVRYRNGPEDVHVRPRLHVLMIDVAPFVEASESESGGSVDNMGCECNKFACHHLCILTLPPFRESHNRGNYAARPC